MTCRTWTGLLGLGVGVVLTMPMAAQPAGGGAPERRFQPADLKALRAVQEVKVSPDGSSIAYSVSRSDGPGRPSSEVWLLNRATGRATRLGDEDSGASGPRWSPDGTQIDNDVPIAEAEQFYIALKDVGVDTTMVRYPREGHGVRETGHAVDLLERSIAWYEKHFAHEPVPSAP